MIQITVGQVAGVIAAAIFVGQYILPCPCVEPS